MSRSAVSVWKATIANIMGLPECPPDLDEPEYVNLAFDEHCHVGGIFSSFIYTHRADLPCLDLSRSERSRYILGLPCPVLQEVHRRKVRVPFSSAAV